MWIKASSHEYGNVFRSHIYEAAQATGHSFAGTPGNTPPRPHTFLIFGDFRNFLSFLKMVKNLSTEFTSREIEGLGRLEPYTVEFKGKNKFQGKRLQHRTSGQFTYHSWSRTTKYVM